MKRFDWQGTYMSDRYANSREGAWKRGLVWHITKQDFLDMCTAPCFYCGQEPSGRVTMRSKANKNSKNGTATVKYGHWNGIDRFDNSRGYEPDNVVSCCRQCNSGKMAGSFGAFLSRCRRVTAKFSSWKPEEEGGCD